MAQSGRRLTARPAESEHPGTEVNHFQELKQPETLLFSGCFKLISKKIYGGENT
jgi:hypothetical protein